MPPSTKHDQRIRTELIEAGVTKSGLRRFTARYLPKVIHQNEHIRGAVYGRFRESAGLLGWVEGMLVATDRRIMFINHRPGYTDIDEYAYDIIAGVKITTAWPFSAVTLHTRTKDYTLRYANTKCAEKFVQYVEIRQLEGNESAEHKAVTEGNLSREKPVMKNSIGLDSPTVKFLSNHGTGVLSTQNKSGNLHSAVIHYLFDSGVIYIATKSSTQKARDILSNPKVSFVAYNENTLETVQLQGIAEIETQPAIKSIVFTEMVKPRKYGSRVSLPPVTTLKKEAYVVVKVTPTSAKYSDYKASK